MDLEPKPPILTTDSILGLNSLKFDLIQTNNQQSIASSSLDLISDSDGDSKDDIPTPSSKLNPVVVKRHKTNFVPSENQLNFTLEATECLDPDKINLCDPTIKLKDLKTM